MLFDGSKGFGGGIEAEPLEDAPVAPKTVEAPKASDVRGERRKTFTEREQRQMKSLKFNILNERAVTEMQWVKDELFALGPKCLQDGMYTFVVKEEGVITGFIAVEAKEGLGSVRELRLKPGEGQGEVAKELLHTAGEYLKTREGCNNLRADVVDSGDSDKAENFFKGNHFRLSFGGGGDTEKDTDEKAKEQVRTRGFVRPLR